MVFTLPQWAYKLSFQLPDDKCYMVRINIQAESQSRQETFHCIGLSRTLLHYISVDEYLSKDNDIEACVRVWVWWILMIESLAIVIIFMRVHQISLTQITCDYPKKTNSPHCICGISDIDAPGQQHSRGGCPGCHQTGYSICCVCVLTAGVDCVTN